MKKIILALLMGFCFLGAFGQVDPVVRSVRFEAQSEAEMNAIPANKLQEGSVCYREDTDSLWRYNGTTWAEMTGVGGLQSTDIDTFAELDAIVADKSLVNLEDPQTFAGFKTFVGGIQVDSSAVGVPGFIRMNSPASTQNGIYGQLNEGVMYFNNGPIVDFSYQDNVAPLTGTLSLDFSAIDGREVFSFPATGGTLALTSDVTGISNLVEDTTPELGGLLDAQNFGIDNVGVLTVGTYIDLTNDIRFVPDNLIGSTTGSNTFGFKTGNVLYGQKVNETIELGLDFNALTADKNLVFTDSDITWGGTSLLSGGGSSPPFDDTTSLVQDPVDGTKEVRIDAGNVPTGTTVTLTAPSSDLNLGNVILGPASATDNNIATFNGTTGKLIKDSGVTLSSGSISGIASISGTGTNFNISMPPTDTEPSGNEGRIYADNSENRPKYHDGTSWKAFLLSGDATDDQTASEVNITDAAGYYTGTDVEAMGQEIGADLADRPTSLGTGRTNAVQYTDVFGQTLADYNTDGAGGAGDLIIITDASPAEVVATATIAMDGWKMYDDQTADAATITLSDCDPGETLTVYINRASAPTLAGTGLTFNQLPNTTAFAAATEMMIIFEVAYDGTTIDYYYVER